MNKKVSTFKYPGVRQAMDGNTAVIMCERESSDAAGAYPITPSTQMGEYWAEEAAKGHVNVSGRPLIFVEPESEHAAAAVTAGLTMTGLRSTNFSSAQGVAFMHESLYAASGKHLPYVLNIGCRAITKASLNVHCAHDDYHCVDDTGFFQVMANGAQGAADLNIIAHKISELSLIPGIVAQDGFLTTHLIESIMVPERGLIEEYLGRPDDIIDTPTPSQKMLYGDKRRRIPAIWDVDNPMTSGSVQNQDAYMQAVAAQRPYFFDHIPAITEQAMEEFYQLTGRRYNRISQYRTEDADYVVLGFGSMLITAQAVADYLRKTRSIKVGVIDVTMFRPFPGDLLGKALKGKKGVVVLERTDQPLAEDLPLMREVRATISKCIENGIVGGTDLPYPDYTPYKTMDETPRLFSGAYGLGSRDLQPEGIIAAIENMLPGGSKRNFFYLSVEFVRDDSASPKQELYQQELLEAYPKIKDLALKGSENPNLMPKDAVTVRMHSVGGWGAITTGKNLAMTLFELLDFDIKANPKYGSEKKGQPTTYYLSAAPEPIRINAEYHYVDVVLSPDPNSFEHSNPVSGLKKGGVLIIQSSLEGSDAVWRSFPVTMQRFIIDNEIQVFYIDAFKVAREEASNPELQLRMQGIAFQGAFFAASPVMETAGLNEKTLFLAIEDQIRAKFGGKGERIVADNLRVVRRGFDEIHEITEKEVVQVSQQMLRKESHLPIMLKQIPKSDNRISDIHRFWEQTGNFYTSGQGSDNLVDPFIGLSLIPASTGIFRDMTQIRFDYPDWVAENCTACGNCYTACPDSAIPGLVNTIGEVFDTTIRRIEGQGMPTRHLRRAVRTVEKKLRTAVEAQGDECNVNQLLLDAINETLVEADLGEQEKNRLSTEFDQFEAAMDGFKFAATKPFYSNKEKRAKGSGGLFSITINPYTCKGCMECVDVCDDDALRAVPQTKDSVDRLRKDWAYWLELPTTSPDYIRIDDLDEKIGALETLLLDKTNYGSMVCGDGACNGCGEKTIIHIFTGTVTALMQARVKKHLAHLEGLIQQLEKHIRTKLADTMDLGNTENINAVIDEHNDIDLTLSRLSMGLDGKGEAQPIDSEWLRWVTQLLEKLKHLKWQYTTGVTNKGRSSMGIVNATGCTSVWGATFPYAPYPFPWASNLFQDSPSMAMGLFEGHMVKMAEGFKAIRQAELEIKGQYKPEEHDSFFTYFNWEQFSDEEFKLCPPVVSVGGDGAMYDIGFQNLSRMMMSGLPVKVLILDTQVYSNTGGQACTSTYVAQVADMAPYGKIVKGKKEIRKEMSVIAMAHRTSYVLQGSPSSVTHLIESYIDGLNSRRPAVFNVYAVCQPEHGVGDEATTRQSKMAVESRAYPLFTYNPDLGTTFEECSSLSGNPSMKTDWPTYKLEYQDEEGKAASMELPLTFADFALTEGRFRKQFRKAPPETWNDNMMPLAEFIDLDDDTDKEELFPYIWAVDAKNRLMRVLVSAEIVNSTIERRDFWRQLKSLVGVDQVVDVEQIANDAKIDMAQKITSSLLAMGGGSGTADMSALLSNSGAGAGVGAATSAATPEDYEPVWIETPECTACDECMDLNPNIFAYNDDKLAIVVDPKAGPFVDIVKAAEKCTAEVIHPGTPFNPNEANLDKLIKRAEKFQ
ncbi:2-oxoacid:acceptor oxidoreductase family protein [Candidatus Venteria ishoeyi]|uniref:Pyruvate-flavodoxin oxidoreductase n=1 Tax=Candidatus Venteria ishoeyi TaxID=1899563 RepID=A0A1H6FFI6_9GAMM|nr:2-oxoacid:acceptor oxidoreductase family protein [Candidatus Venteria ishoeyi]SEH07774.1 Pyruvate-flavodoxin oxidoreductase [Candidatus Venteria ishoeyi]